MERERLSPEYLKEVQLVVSRLALKTGAMLKYRFEQADKPVDISKGGVDFTTSADVEADQIIIQGLQKYNRSIPILTEETALADYSQLREAEQLWIVDPLDGTTNFSRKRAHFGISVALVSRGIPHIAIVYLPMQNELYTATRTTPTLLNGKPIHVSQTATLSKAWIESGISWNMEARQKFAEVWFPVFSRNVRAFTMSGSAVADMAKVAEGQVDGFVYCGIKPWDQAATGLLIQQAGGRITTSRGIPWNTFESDMIASNDHVHQQLLDLLASP